MKKTWDEAKRLASQRAAVLDLHIEERLPFLQERWNEYSSHLEQLTHLKINLCNDIDAQQIAKLQVENVTTELVAAAPKQRTRALQNSTAFVKIFSDAKPGVPAIAVKDMIAVEGHKYALGTNMQTMPISSRDANIIARLRQTGVHVTGMVNMHALAYGATGMSSAVPPPHNALDVLAMPGGSSSGSAVAVAEGAVDFALGTDTGGSVRIPACLNGIVGFKPSHGRIWVDGVYPLAPSLDHLGFFARSVAQVAALFARIDQEAGQRTRRKAIRDQKIIIGLPENFFLEEMDAITRRSYEHCLGTSAKPIPLSHFVRL